MIRGLCQFALGVSVLALSGCATFVAHEIEHPGHYTKADDIAKLAGFQRHTWRNPAGVTLSYLTGEPRQYGVKVKVTTSHTATTWAANADLHFDGKPKSAPRIPVRGSVVLLHPWGASGAAMGIWALLFAQSGYQVVAPDFRDQGDSGNAKVGYGPREAKDIIGLIHRLQQHGQLPQPVYLFGDSYGATVALFAAPRLSVRGVIAMEPYDNAASVIRRAPQSGLFGFHWLVRFLSPSVMTRAIRKADHDLDLDLSRISPERAVSEARACTLIVRGTHDKLVPAGPLQAMAWSSPRVRLMPVNGENHMSVFIRTDRLFKPLLQWMRSVPEHGATCPTPPHVGGAGSLLPSATTSVQG